MRPRFRFQFFWLASFAVGTVGCGGEDSASHQIRGNVSYEGRSLVSGTVMFQPTIGKTVIGVIQSDGSFTLSAPAGSYRIGIVSLAEIPSEVDVWKPGAMLPLQTFPAKYHRPEHSGIAVDVAANDRNEVTLVLPLRSDKPSTR